MGTRPESAPPCHGSYGGGCASSPERAKLSAERPRRPLRLRPPERITDQTGSRLGHRPTRPLRLPPPKSWSRHVGDSRELVNTQPPRGEPVPTDRRALRWRHQERYRREVHGVGDGTQDLRRPRPGHTTLPHRDPLTPPDDTDSVREFVLGQAGRFPRSSQHVSGDRWCSLHGEITLWLRRPECARRSTPCPLRRAARRAAEC